mmetsp:Transcript_4154/g.10726  ORF Transcript_4154/g.10726 Transcript_4154/m.10726 type:complete len:323 (+) Transcript_4154:271-1239(+)
MVTQGGHTYRHLGGGGQLADLRAERLLLGEHIVECGGGLGERSLLGPQLGGRGGDGFLCGGDGGSTALLRSSDRGRARLLRRGHLGRAVLLGARGGRLRLLGALRLLRPLRRALGLGGLGRGLGPLCRRLWRGLALLQLRLGSLGLPLARHRSLLGLQRHTLRARANRLDLLRRRRLGGLGALHGGRARAGELCARRSLVALCIGEGGHGLLLGFGRLRARELEVIVLFLQLLLTPLVGDAIARGLLHRLLRRRRRGRRCLCRADDCERLRRWCRRLLPLGLRLGRRRGERTCGQCTWPANRRRVGDRRTCRRRRQRRSEQC